MVTARIPQAARARSTRGSGEALDALQPRRFTAAGEGLVEAENKTAAEQCPGQENRSIRSRILTCHLLCAPGKLLHLTKLYLPRLANRETRDARLAGGQRGP